MNQDIITYNQEGNLITKTINGIEKSKASYEIYVDNKSVSDFAYYQLDEEIVKKFGWTYCSATALATCLGLYYNDNNIKPLTFEDSFTVGAGLQTWGHINEDVKVKKTFLLVKKIV